MMMPVVHLLNLEQGCANDCINDTMSFTVSWLEPSDVPPFDCLMNINGEIV